QGIYVDPAILEYISKLVRATREHAKVEVGASPRGGLAMLKAARALALIHGRDFVVPDDVRSVAADVLAHRLILRPEVVLEGVSDGAVLNEILEATPVPTELRRHPAPAGRGSG
ncbi:MAG: MoxR family ATPase, partial [Chloroflexi bacterium]|nr:MoxR family ATPase [Chloroflexota bacterium]